MSFIYSALHLQLCATMGSVDHKELPRLEQPPPAGGSYVIPQLEGEMLSIPGSKSVFRILTSALQTDDTISVFTSGGALADAPGFHHHNEAHDVFIVTKGFVKLWNGDKCKILGPGDFAYVPPVRHPTTPSAVHTHAFLYSLSRRMPFV